jgi:hypothetical protein
MSEVVSRLPLNTRNARSGLVGRASWATAQGSKEDQTMSQCTAPARGHIRGGGGRLPSSRTHWIRLLDAVVPTVLTAAGDLCCQEWKPDEQRRWA